MSSCKRSPRRVSPRSRGDFLRGIGEAAAALAVAVAPALAATNRRPTAKVPRGPGQLMVRCEPVCGRASPGRLCGDSEPVPVRASRRARPPAFQGVPARARSRATCSGRGSNFALSQSASATGPITPSPIGGLHLHIVLADLDGRKSRMVRRACVGWATRDGQGRSRRAGVATSANGKSPHLLRRHRRCKLG